MSSDNIEQTGAARPAFVERCGDLLTKICLAIAGVALICIVLVNGANVTARYVFGKPFSWAEEAMLFMMILAVFSGAIAVTWRNMHIRIDTFVDLMPPAARRAALVIGALASIGVIAAIVYASANLLHVLHLLDQRSDALDMPAWFPQSFLTVSLTLIALIIAVRTVQALAKPSGSREDRR